MSYNENTTTTYPGHVPPKNKRRWIAPTATGVAALLVGIGIGSAGEKVETVTIDRPVEVEKVVTETITEEVEVTPDACITALDHADGLLDASLTVIDVASGAFGLIPRAAEAGMDYDVAAMEQIAVEGEEMGVLIEEQTAVVGPLRANYDAAVEECRGSGA